MSGAPADRSPNADPANPGGPGSPAPDTCVLRGARCTLRAFRPDELDELLAARHRVSADPDGFAGPREIGGDEREKLRRRIAASGRLHDGWLEFAIEVAGRLVGDVQGRGGRRMLPPGVYELGIELYDATSRGKGIGIEAVALLTTHLFAELGAGRVQATTDVTNAPMRAVLARLGFHEEGVLRDFMPSRNDATGARNDYVLAAVTAADWAGPRGATRP